MARVYFARGCRGAIPRKLQVCLDAAGYYNGAHDGVYGGGTEKAVLAFQEDRGLPGAGKVDEPTWVQSTASPIPSVQERCLQLTAAFEGHGFSTVAGNFDGAWLTWGIIGFTLKHGELRRIILSAWERDPSTVLAAFGDRTMELIGLMTRNDAPELEGWANSISLGAKKYVVAEPWNTGFKKLGESALVQAIQIERAVADYFQPALATAGRFNLITELGIELSFDIHVQNGGVKDEAADAFVKALGSDFTAQPESARREALARAVAENIANKQYVADVMSRKMTVATGSGTVHGEAFTLANWGLADVRAQG